MSGINRSITQARDGQVIVGIKKDLQNVSSLPLGNSTYTMASLEALIQSRIDAANAVANARAQWVSVSAKYDALNTQVTPVVRGLRQYMVNAYGQDNPILADFGFTPVTRRKLTADEQVASNQKALATRKARGTTGKRQKAKIKGTVPTTALAVPPTAPLPTAAPPAATAAPPAAPTAVTPAPAVAAAVTSRQ